MIRIPRKGEEEKSKGILVIINPCNPSQNVIDGIKKVEKETNSEVEYLLSPCDWHYLFIGHYLPHFAKAKAYIPPGRIQLQNPKFAYTLVDMDNPLPELAPHIQIVTWRGMSDNPDANPVVPRGDFVYFHPESKLMTSGDCLGYFKERGFVQVLGGQASGQIIFNYKGYKHIHDADLCIETVKRILNWDFDRYVYIHGPLGNFLEKGAKESLAKLLTFFEKPPKGYKKKEALPFKSAKPIEEIPGAGEAAAKPAAAGAESAPAAAAAPTEQKEAAASS